MLNRYNIVFAVSMLFACAAFSQEQFGYDARVEKQFTSALKLFTNGAYTEADAVFSDLITKEQMHQRTTACYIMSAKAKFKLEQYHESIALLREFLGKFTETEYRDDAKYTLGLNQFMLHRYTESMAEFVAVLDTTDDRDLYGRTASLMKVIADKHLRSAQVMNLFAEAKTQESKDYVSLLAAERLYAEGNASESKRYLNTVLHEETLSKFSTRIKLLSEKISSGNNIVIGILLPLMRSEPHNPVKEFADDIYSGIEFALQEWGKEFPSSADITLDVRDTGRDSLTAINSLQDLADDEHIVGVVGPLFSDIALACAPIADKAGLPMISPTASANSLASERTHFFQANPDIDTRARAAAGYMVQELGYRRVAVLADSNESGKALSEEFVKEARRLGAEILALVYYHTDSSDLRSQFLELRRQGTRNVPHLSFADNITRYEINRMVRAGADAQLLDEVRRRKGSVSVTDLFGPGGIRIADSLRLKVVQPEDFGENLEIPLSSIQGLFVPISDAEHVGIIASQIRYFNIQTQLFGSGEWYDLSELDEHKRDADGVMFVSDSYTDEQDPAYIAFVESFRQFRKQRPTKYTLYGYDTMNFLLHQITDRNLTRTQLTAALNRPQQYKGIHSYISLSSNRVNSYLHILQYKNGKVQKIGDLFIN